MLAAFLAVVGRGPAIPEAVDEVLRSTARPRGLPFTPADHLYWADENATVRVAAWWDGDPDATAWAVDDDGIVVVAGDVRRRRDRWLEPHRWPGLIRPLLGVSSPDCDQLVGSFAALAVGPSGGLALTDPFAQRSLYVAHAPTHDVIASDPALAAAGAAGARTHPPLDAEAVCGLAYTRYRIGDRTGFAQVESLPIGSFVTFAAGRGLTRRVRPAPWAPDARFEDLDQRGVLDLCQETLEHELRTDIDFPSPVVTLDLTGGKDSRLVLAVALGAGLADRVVLRTDGPSDVRDVVVARQVAEAAGVRWLGRDDLGPYLRRRLGGAGERPSHADRGVTRSDTWTDAVRRYVGTTAGVSNLWRAKPPTGNPLVTRISGLSGEMLRSSVHRPLRHDADLVRRLDGHYGLLDLLRPEALARYRREWVTEVRCPVDGATDANDRHDLYLLRTQIRSNFGPREEWTPHHRLMPLSDPTAVQCAFASGSAARMQEALHRGIIERAAPELARVPFVDRGWPALQPPFTWSTRERARYWRSRLGGHRRRIARPTAAGRPRDSTISNIAARQRRTEGPAERIDLLREVVADRTNPVWEHLDRSAVSGAVDRYVDLPQGAQLELMGAATAALWLADGPW